MKLVSREEALAAGLRNKKYREANRKKIRLRNKKYREANRKKIRLRNKKHYEANSEKIRLHVKKYREANPEKTRLRHKKYREANPEKRRLQSKKYREANPEKFLAYRGLPLPTRPKPSTCECCNTPQGKLPFHLDHDHDTGEFRGWLCMNCNTAIGKLGDTIEGVQRAIGYLKRSGGIYASKQDWSEGVSFEVHDALRYQLDEALRRVKELEMEDTEEYICKSFERKKVNRK